MILLAAGCRTGAGPGSVSTTALRSSTGVLPVVSPEASPSSSLVLTGSFEGPMDVMRFNEETGVLTPWRRFNGGTRSNFLAFSPDHSLVYVAERPEGPGDAAMGKITTYRVDHRTADLDKVAQTSGGKDPFTSPRSRRPVRM